MTQTSAQVQFLACDRSAADKRHTDLRPRTLVATTAAEGHYDIDVPAGRVVLESPTTLTIDKGQLVSGSGGELLFAGPVTPVRVASGTVKAQVTLAVLESPTAGRRVAFVELRIDDDVPVRWDDEPSLMIGTDGGDGGFMSASALVEPDVDVSNDYVDAFFPDHDSASGNVCVLRAVGNHKPDAFFFSTGYGDGGYPTVLGRAADGHVVSVVSYGFVVPWALSGLPGRPPAEVVAATPSGY